MEEKRFKKIYHEKLLEQGLSFGMKEIAGKIEVMMDSSTKVQYCIVQSAAGGEMAAFPLLDTDGKPLMDKPEE